MDYRDPLAAALARIQALETELAETRAVPEPAPKPRHRPPPLPGLQPPPLPEDLAMPAHSLPIMAAADDPTPATSAEVLADLIETMAHDQHVAAPRPLARLHDHNTSLPPPPAYQSGAGVACPRCRDQVEMVQEGLQLGTSLAAVMCPVCGYAGWLRKR